MDIILVKVVFLLIITAAAHSGRQGGNRKGSAPMLVEPEPLYLVSPSQTFQINCQFTRAVILCMWYANSTSVVSVPGRFELLNHHGDPTDCSVRVTRLDEEYAGKWSCTGVDDNQNVFQSNIFEVTIIQRASRVDISYNSKQMKEDEMVEMTCEAQNAKPNPDLKWLILNGSEIMYELEGSPTEVSSPGSFKSRLSYLPNYEHNEMELGCAADILKNNTYISEYVTIRRNKLDIMYLPKVSANTPNEFLVNKENAVVTIQIFSNPAIKSNNIRWRVRDSILRPGQAKNGVLAEEIVADETARGDVFLVSLRISKVEQPEEFTLYMNNYEFQQENSFIFRVALDTSGGAFTSGKMAAIIVPILIILVILIIGTVVAKRRSMFCFAPGFRVTRRHRVPTTDPDAQITIQRNNQVVSADHIRNTKFLNANPPAMVMVTEERAVTATPDESPPRSEAATPPISQPRYHNSDV